MLDKTTPYTAIDRYARAVLKSMNPASIVLFGSYANGTPTEESDIDVAVIFNQFSGDKWGASSLLWKMTVDIDDRIEPVLLESSNDPSGFVDEVLRTGRVIYSAV
ncbi:MAG: nucleotidyltransferase domain-containing protein [Oscillospiraceae bacterium]|jgi:predicted nucleotidyltransferase|nr:nucleotidyltransferase domain-containing protein [Oscillospiraceae bacterium]